MTAFELAGTLEDGVHRLVQRVYYEDTDFSGLVYHARYLHFLERAGPIFSGSPGSTRVRSSAMPTSPSWSPTWTSGFRASARMDDVVTVVTQVEEASAGRMVMAQQLLRGETVLVQARFTVAAIDGPAGRAACHPCRPDIGLTPRLIPAVPPKRTRARTSAGARRRARRQSGERAIMMDGHGRPGKDIGRAVIGMSWTSAAAISPIRPMARPRRRRMATMARRPPPA